MGKFSGKLYRGRAIMVHRILHGAQEMTPRTPRPLPDDIMEAQARIDAATNPVTVFTNGCFDLLHPGHVRFLQKARKMGDRLIVAVNDDASVKALKGEGRPVFSLEDRLAMLMALEDVDGTIGFTSEQGLAERIKFHSPDILVKGSEWRGKDITGSEYAGRVEFIDSGSSEHTSDVLGRLVACDPLRKGIAEFMALLEREVPGGREW